MPRILVAEGHAPTRDYVQRSLGDAGFEVLAANDVGSAFELFSTRRPDAVVLGSDFAEGEGYALVRKLRDADPRVLLVVADKQQLHGSTPPDLVERVSRLVSRGRAQAPQRRTPRPSSPALAAAPDWQGELALGAVARLFHQLWENRSDGVLVLAEGDLERHFLFHRGVANGFWSPAADESLLRWICGERHVAERARTMALEAMAGGLSACTALVAAGVVEPGDALAALLRRHLGARIVRAVGAREGRWRFHAGPPTGGDWSAVELRAPLAPVLEGARGAVHANHQIEALRNVAEAFPVRGAAFQAIAQAAALSPTDLRLALSIGGRQTTRTWLEARRAELRDGLSLLWFLSLTGAVIFPVEPAGATPPPHQGPRGLPPLPPERAEALRQAALQLLPASPYGVLGVNVTADTDEVERAYHALARRFHPDAYAGHDLGDLEDLLVAVQDRISAAYRALATGERRATQLALMTSRLEQAGVRRPGLDPLAELALFRAWRALEERRPGDAVEALRTACVLAPREAEYHAMLAFATLHDPALPPGAQAREALRIAEKALGMQPDHPRAIAALALAEDRLGDSVEARRVLLAGLRVHPEHAVLKEALARMLARR
ncbi:MAG: DnaJ domain-containing protein [Anaeromyxobacteraceae bacterium]